MFELFFIITGMKTINKLYITLVEILNCCYGWMFVCYVAH